VKKVILFAMFMFAVVCSTATVVYAQNGSNFGTTCDKADESSKDPIYEPRHAHGEGHDHIFFGMLNVRNLDTGDTLRDRDESSCNRVNNNSAYWIPQIYRNGETLPMFLGKGLGDNTIYYRAGKIDNHRSIEPFPRDFEMVARDEENSGDVKWACDGGGLRDTVPGTCKSKTLNVRLEFPQCWNDKHTSDRIKEPENVVDAIDGACPTGYRAVPMITFATSYKLPSENVGRITVAGSDDDGHFVRKPASSMHGDFVNGWNQNRLSFLTENCINKVPDSATTDDKLEDCQDPER